MATRVQILWVTAVFMAIMANTFPAELKAGNGVPHLLPFQGRVTDGDGRPINIAVPVKFQFFPPGGTCYLYEETQIVLPNAYGIFSVVLGSAANSTGPANSFVNVFNNDVSAPLTDSCGGSYTPASGDWRQLLLIVDGNPLPQMQTIAAAAFSFNAQMLEGKTSLDFILKSGQVTQTNLTSLVGGGDAGSLHNHDGLYARRDGSNSFAGSVTTSQNIYASSATGQIGIGTSSASADLEISKNSPTIRLNAVSGGGGNEVIEFYSGTNQRARIESSEGTDGIKIYSGSSEALSIDATKSATFFGSIRTLGTVGLGKYSTAQELDLVTALLALGPTATGSLWVNSTTNAVRYWDGSSAQTFSSTGTGVNSLTVGAGLNNSGTAGDPNIRVAYGSAANTAIQGNASFGGDVSGNYGALSVNKLKGHELDFSVAPLDGQILLYDGVSSKWKPNNAPATGISSLNGLSSATQTFATGVSGTQPNLSSAGSTHTLNIPMAQTASVTAGLLSKTDYDIFNAKQNALGFTPANKAGDTLTGPLVLQADPGTNLGAATKQYVDSTVNAASGALVRRDGTSAFSGSQSLGGFNLTNVANPTAAQDAATKTYADGKFGGSNLDLTGRADGDSVKWDNGNSKWIIYTPGAGAGTVTSVSGVGPISVGTPTTTPSISISDATGAAKGVVQVGTGINVSTGTISVNYGTGAGSAVEGNDARMSPATVLADASKMLRVNAGGTAYELRTPAQVRSDIGATATGDALFTAANAGAARTAIGATATGDALIVAANAGAARTAIGATATGDALIVAANAGAGRSAIGAAASGANSDITSLSGLTTPLSLLQGGVGVDASSVAANKILASPDGSAGGPTFRSLVAADIPTGTDTTKLPLTGGTMAGAIAMGTFKITGMGDPTAAQDAATKTYADGKFGGSTLDLTGLAANNVVKWNGSSWVVSTSVASFNTRTGAVVPATNDYTWAQIDKSTSDLANITTRNANDLNGTLADARLTSNVAMRNAANTWSTGDQSMSAATSLTVPVGAGAAPTANGRIAYDSTANQWRIGVNTVSNFMCQAASSLTSGQFVQGGGNGVVSASGYSAVAAGSAGIAAYNAGNAATLARSDHTHRSFYSLQWFIPGQVAAGVQVARAQVPKGVTNCTITDSQMTVNTTSGSASNYNIQRCTAAGPACTSTANIYTGNVSLGGSAETVAGGLPNTATISAGDVFRVNLTGVGAGLADVTITMTYKCENTN